MPRSVASVASNASQRSRASYRTVSRTSNVDEALFGSSKPASRQAPGSAANTIRKSALNSAASRRAAAVKPSDPTAVVISRTDLDRMRASAKRTVDDQQRLAQETKGDMRRTKQLMSKDRRDRLAQKERESKATRVKTEGELEKEAKEEALRGNAMSLKKEDIDEVKKMNSMMLYAKCAAVRDAQLEEKRQMKEQAKEEERRLDEMMEYERRRLLAEEQQRDRQRHEESRARARQLLGQIAEREADRVLEQQQMEKEREDVLRHMELMKQEEEEKVKQKREYAAQLMKEVAETNDTLVNMREERKLREREEELAIERYHLEVALKKEALLAEQEERQRQLEKQKQIIAEKQEQQLNKLAARDELLARRAMEEKDRQHRAKEKAEQEKRAKQRAELDVARQQQIRLKKIRIAEQALNEQDQFQQIAAEQQMVKDRHRVEWEKKQKQKKAIADGLKVQVAEAAELKKKALVDKFSEGEKLRREQEIQRAQVEAIRAEKVQGLAKLGVPTKYVADLEKKKFA